MSIFFNHRLDIIARNTCTLIHLYAAATVVCRMEAVHVPPEVNSHRDSPDVYRKAAHSPWRLDAPVCHVMPYQLASHTTHTRRSKPLPVPAVAALSQPQSRQSPVLGTSPRGGTSRSGTPIPAQFDHTWAEQLDERGLVADPLRAASDICHHVMERRLE